MSTNKKYLPKFYYLPDYDHTKLDKVFQDFCEWADFGKYKRCIKLDTSMCRIIESIPEIAYILFSTEQLELGDKYFCAFMLDMIPLKHGCAVVFGLRAEHGNKYDKLYNKFKEMVNSDIIILDTSEEIYNSVGKNLKLGFNNIEENEKFVNEFLLLSDHCKGGMATKEAL